jgi:transposase InsO family protein
VRYQFIEDHREEWPIDVQCDVLAVSRSGYYAWRGRPPSARQRRHAELVERIRVIHHESRQTYGSPRVHRQLVVEGSVCNEKTVAKLMKAARIQAKTTKRFRVMTTDSTHGLAVAPNVVDRDFAPMKRNQTWSCDITYIPTREGWLYLAAIEDLRTRKIVGWSMAPSMESRLVVDALEMAIARETPVKGLVAHSDRGSQYASDHYQRHLAAHGITCSMSRKGNCWDNAPIESFFATLKKELVHHEDYQTIEEAKRSIFEYIEVFYNRKRRHSALGYLSPEEFELAA